MKLHIKKLWCPDHFPREGTYRQLTLYPAGTERTTYIKYYILHHIYYKHYKSSLRKFDGLFFFFFFFLLFIFEWKNTCQLEKIVRSLRFGVTDWPKLNILFTLLVVIKVTLYILTCIFHSVTFQTLRKSSLNILFFVKRWTYCVLYL